MNNDSILSTLKNPKYKGIIFDFDETLFLLKMDWDALKRILEKTMLDIYDIEIKFTPYVEALARLKRENDTAYKKALEIIEKLEREGLKNGRPNKIFLDFIREESNKKFGIYSMNTTNTIQAFLEEYNLQSKFSAISTQNTCLGYKPSGKDLLHISQKWGYNNTEVLYIGNSDYDKKSGEMANVDTAIIQM